MAADTDAAELGSAWKHVGFAPSDARFGSFTRTRIERIIAVVIGVGCLVLGGQAFIAAMGGGEDAAWRPALQLGVFVPLALMLLACFAGRGQRLFASVFIAFYIGVLLLWPTAAGGVRADPAAEPWLFYLINVGTVATVLAFPLVWQIVLTATIPLLWGLVRLVQAHFALSFVVPVVLDVSFALILGGIMVSLGWVLRSMAASVDSARERAVASYTAVASAAAVERERAEVGALMHDRVLAALIAVERAGGDRERTLAAGMARDALTGLADAEHGGPAAPTGSVSAADVAARIAGAASEHGVALRVRRSGPDVAIPGAVARAVVLAAGQAVANAVQHAQAAGLRVDIVADVVPLGVTVQVQDRGPGFDPDAVPPDRLGVRASILARMAAVGGAAHITSGGTGTTVRLEWSERDS